MSIYNKKTIKFITYDGILEPIGDSQVLSYLKYISKTHYIKLLSYEKKNDLKNIKNIKIKKKYLKKLNIEWKILKYHDYLSFISTLHNIINGYIDNIIDLIKRKIDIFHIRGPLPGLLIIPFLYFFNIKFIFDMRGFWADEKVDRLGWEKNSIIYKFFKKIEKILLLKSNSVVCLTKDSKKILIDNYKIDKNKITIIPTCVDLDYYKFKEKRNKKNINFCHLGSLESAYNIEKIINFFNSLLKFNKKIKIFFYTNQNPKKLNYLMKKYNIPKKNYTIENLDKKKLINKLKYIDIGIFCCNKNFSIKGSFPTKIGEFLASGIPIICNNFNKEVFDLIIKNKVGIINEFEDQNYSIVFKKIKKMINSKKINSTSRKICEEKLSIEIGSKKFLRIYKSIL